MEARAHLCLNALLHRIILGDLAHVGVDERVRLAHHQLVLVDLEHQTLVELVAVLLGAAFNGGRESEVDMMYLVFPLEIWVEKVRLSAWRSPPHVQDVPQGQHDPHQRADRRAGGAPGPQEEAAGPKDGPHHRPRAQAADCEEGRARPSREGLVPLPGHQMAVVQEAVDARALRRAMPC